MFRSRGARRLAPIVSGALLLGLMVLVTPSAAALDSPSGLTATGGSARILSWQRVPGATAYDVEVARTTSFSPTLVKVSTVNDEYVPTVQLPTGEVWWRVRAKVGSTLGDWSTTTFNVAVDAAPVPVRPLSGTTFRAPTSPSFSWEPVPGATSYTVEASTDVEFTDIDQILSSVKQKTTAAYIASFPESGTYYWRVQAELGTGYATEWSEPLPFHVVGLPSAELVGPPDAFGPVDPRNPAGPPLPEVTDVVLDWAPVTGAATYDLQVSTDDDFVTTVENKVGIKGTSYSPPVTLNNDEYYWRVRPVDASNNKASWPATPWKFRRSWSDQPVPTYPAGMLDPQRPFFYEWEPIERASRYGVILYDESGAVVCDTLDRPTFHTTLTGTCVPTGAGSYRWRVVGIDDPAAVVTDQLSQPPMSFEYTPPAPVNPAPAGTLSMSDVENARVSLTGTAAFTGTPGDACDDVWPDTCLNLLQSPVLTWDPVPGATSYWVNLYQDRELTNWSIKEDGYVVNQPMWTIPRDVMLPDSQAGSAYFWVVQPCGVTCAPMEHATHSFAKKSAVPQPMDPDRPSDLDPTVADDVTLTWGTALAAAQAPGGAEDSSVTALGTTDARQYIVQADDNVGFTSPAEATVDQTTFTSFAGTYPEGRNYWRVRAVDGDGNLTAWSRTGTFVKRSRVPQLLMPEDGAALGADYTLTWEAVPFAKEYDVEVFAGPTRVANVTTTYTSWTPSTPFPASATGYSWHVRRVDADGRRGKWSDRLNRPGQEELRTFQFEGFPVSATAPASSAVVPPSGGRFSWLLDARATSYRFERRKPGTTDLAEAVTTRATAWSPTTALVAGTAQWRVVALDAAGASLGSSPWRDFVVIDPPAVVTPVTIAGSGAVGTELRAYAPTFDPAAESTTYQWFRGTSPIASATGEIYTVVAADLGKSITVRATGTVPGYQSVTSTSNVIGGVSGPSLTIVSPVSMSGNGVVGTELTAGAPVFDPVPPTISYQWFRGTSPISSATGETYTVVAADLGKAITVRATGSGVPGYQDTTSTSDAVTGVSTPPITIVAPVVVTGSGAVGSELRATAPTFDPVAAAVAYQWYRGTSSISGATSDTYVVGSSDVGKQIIVKATGSAAGYTSATSTSTPVTGVTGGAPAAERAPDVSGTAAVGSRLTVLPGAWAGSPKLTYQWYRDGVPISRATSTSYTPAATDAAHSLTVVETATLTGRAPGTATSPAVTVAKVASTAKLTLSAVKTTVRKRVTATVTITASGLVAPGGSVSVYVGKKRVKVLPLSAGTSVKLKLPKLKAGTQTVRAVYTGGAQVLGSSSAKVKLKVTKR